MGGSDAGGAGVEAARPPQPGAAGAEGGRGPRGRRQRRRRGLWRRPAVVKEIFMSPLAARMGR